MIKLLTAHIEEVRGIRKLDLDLRGETFAISGPNGSGKSGVIDAIEFALTGQIGRLTGRGTKGLSVAEHGPHVDKAKFPDAAFVRLQVLLPAAKKVATITRTISAPSKPVIEPPDDDVKAVFAELAEHPELALSRREILRFILVEPTKRSEEIQAILKLDEIGQTRSALNTAQNKLQTAHRTAVAKAQSDREALQRHLQIATLRAEELLRVVNARRAILGLSPIMELSPDTRLDAGLSNETKLPTTNRSSALRDLKALADAAPGFTALEKAAAGAIVAEFTAIRSASELIAVLQRRSFVEKGLALVSGPECPLCDKRWDDEQALQKYIRNKLAKSEEARGVQQRLLASGAAIAASVVRVVGLLEPVKTLAQADGEAPLASLIAVWIKDLSALKDRLATVEGLEAVRERFAGEWLRVPNGLCEALSAFAAKLEAKPDQSATLDAQTFLTTAQLRIGDYREAMRASAAAEYASRAAKTAYEAYCLVLEDALNTLYEGVQGDFSEYYREINDDDEAKFTAKLTPTAGKLDLDVNFYERGLFPPGAYHSEGHQDGMGVCLYLALMKRLFGNRFTLALLDDVVMSVDAGHRYRLCRLLKTRFPNTQFIVTTHDRLWAEQMKSAGLVTKKTSLAFHGWTIDTGPLVESDSEIWEEISAALANDKVDAAAAALRHHLEYAARHLADQLGAAPQFRADGNYELGDLLPSVLVRMKALLGKAAEAAQSWGNTAAKDAASSRKAELSGCAGATSVEQWAVNKAVHYNEWANFGTKDFEPVANAFKQLLACFACGQCGSWLYATPRASPDSLRCACGAVNLNLRAKPK
ncbi:ATP-binding protein [Anaeromyxobacter oryzisoli]|uniref:ATP-binding protein n=1 Tax=Anaeromyxobacter oryzisoli TaxID=2925408 RepID=UPI001F5689EC|nr:ATP-binding protein [Anaeromyxobacter sp. SG63]